MMSSTFSEILGRESLSSHYQPIVSVKKKLNIGAEALARATDVVTGSSVSPHQLFDWARQENQSLELERLCRKKAMQGFGGLRTLDPDLLLFVNFEVGVLDKGVL